MFVRFGFLLTAFAFMVLTAKFLWWVLGMNTGLPIHKESYFHINLILCITLVQGAVFVAFKIWHTLGSRFLTQDELKQAITHKW